VLLVEITDEEKKDKSNIKKSNTTAKLSENN
jgi:hypothetical protein